MALETFSLRQQLKQTRQELSTALYHHDAAIRVAARLTKERDEARESLAQLAASVGTGAPVALPSNGVTNGDKPEGESSHTEEEPLEEGKGIPQEISDEIVAKAQELTAGRKKRKPPTGWATASQIEAFSKSPQTTTKQLFTTVTSLTSDPTGKLLLTGGGKSQAGVYSHETQSIVTSISTSGIVTGAVWTSDNNLVLATKNGQVDIFEYNASEQTATALGSSLDLKKYGRVVALARHPVSSLVVAISTLPASKANPTPVSSLSLLKIGAESEVVLTVSSKPGVVYHSLSIHPDGILVAIGTEDGFIQLHDLKSNANLAASFDVNSANSAENVGEVTALSFSENGYWLASAVSNIPASALLWDLRKQTQTTIISFPSAAAQEQSVVRALAFDFSGQFLAAVASTGILDVVGYTKASKSWTQESLFTTSELAQPVTSNVQWGALGLGLATISARGVVQYFRAPEDVEMQE